MKKITAIIKKRLNIKSYEPLSSTLPKKWRLFYGPKIYKRKFSIEELMAEIIKCGIKPGSNVLIHCSWNEMYNFTGTESQLIQAILDLIGPEGTLMMPAYPLLSKGKLFNVNRSITAAGTLAETFRRWSGVKRSCNVIHSCCAIGPASDYLLSEHHLSDNCWDEKSPYYRFTQINGTVLSLGMHKYYVGTIVHCVEGTLYKSNPYFASFFDLQSRKEYQYIDSEGQICSYFSYAENDRIIRKNKYFVGLRIVRRYFDKRYYQCRKLSNLIINSVDANYAFNRLVELSKSGIVYYSLPKYKKNHERKIFGFNTRNSGN